MIDTYQQIFFIKRINELEQRLQSESFLEHKVILLEKEV
jgi:hypothetical protein